MEADGEGAIAAVGVAAAAADVALGDLAAFAGAAAGVAFCVDAGLFVPGMTVAANAAHDAANPTIRGSLLC
ncbi:MULTISPECIES: hypothetical protein [Lysobacter]|uniref:hypothetical protein n=1 Tax=Lysobacter TaxID=68 RepID=UPI00068B76E0|nr:MULTISPECIES: hypothetical protein [Lysobacter]